SSLMNLMELDLSYNNISDISPLYAITSNNWSGLDLSNNHICGDAESLLYDMIISDVIIDVSNQSCVCSSDDLGTTPLASNKVCSETKPGSNTWYVVCASDSYTSYTSAEDFSCTSPDNGDGTYGCSGGCEYGYECRYDSDLYSTSCQQVIVDENLHDCVADMFVDSDGNDDYSHRTNSTPSLFSVPSLKTLVTVEDEDGNISPILICSSSDCFVSNFSGIEHVGFITKMQFYHLDISETKDIEPFSALSNLTYLRLYDEDLSDSVDSFDLPDFTSLTSLDTLDIQYMPIALPSEYVLPSTIKQLKIYGTPIDQAGFDKNVGYDYLSSLEYLQFGGENNLITSIESLSENQLSTIIGFYFDDYPIYDGFNDVISEMTSLINVRLANCNLLTIPDLSNSATTLTYLSIYSNPDITSLVSLAEMELYSLQTIILFSCSISDISPLYDFPSLSGISIINNKICLGTNSTLDLIAKFTQSSVSIILGTQSCECSSDSTAIGYTDTPITDNVVCSETVPGSGSWHYVCSSHSIASYTSVDTFECLAPLNTDGETYGCSGGCEYGYECRYDDELTLSTYSCYPVIVDENLHAYVADMFGTDANGDPDYTHRTATSPSLFSVASLRTISSSTLSNDGISLSNSDRFSLLDGIEHIRSLTSISLPYHNFVSANPLGSLHGLESLSLAHNMYGAPEDAGGNVIEGFSDLSFICSLHSLSTLTLSSVTSVSALPNTSECADTYTSLSSLNLAETSIIDVSALLVAADSTNVSLMELIMNGASLYDDVAETTSLFDPSILESFS
ncbi:hypothetical protein ADUPG1_010498, partial [Aduncisulcus paluster]